MQQPSLFRLLRLWLLCLPLVGLISSCANSRYYRQGIMFRTPSGQGVDTMKLRAAVNRTARNYLIQPNDFLQVAVYTNKGERILDPNGELQFGSPGLGSGSGGSGSHISQSSSRPSGGGASTQSSTGTNEFMVQSNGRVRLPMVNMVSVAGLTLLQADSLLQLRYSEYYKDVFVATHVTNNRVFVLGSPGGRVVPMLNDNMNLLEVLASVGGLTSSGSTGGGGGSSPGLTGGRSFNIRLIRGDLKNPQVQVIDLSTIDGMRRANLQMEPNDVVYIEPISRPFFQAINDVGTVFGIIGGVTSLVTTLYLLKNLK